MSIRSRNSGPVAAAARADAERAAAAPQRRRRVEKTPVLVFVACALVGGFAISRALAWAVPPPQEHWVAEAVQHVDQEELVAKMTSRAHRMNAKLSTAKEEASLGRANAKKVKVEALRALEAGRVFGREAKTAAQALKSGKPVMEMDTRKVMEEVNKRAAAGAKGAVVQSAEHEEESPGGVRGGTSARGRGRGRAK